MIRLAMLLAIALSGAAAAQGVLVPLMGKRLHGPGGEELGRLVDVVADARGLPVAVVVDVGGFMGLGTRRVAVAWTLLRFRAGDERVQIAIDLPVDVVTAAPEFRPGEPGTVLDGTPRK